MQQDTASFIQTLAKTIEVIPIGYQPEQVLPLIKSAKNKYQDVFVFEANLKKTEKNEPSYTVIAYQKLLDVQFKDRKTLLIANQQQFISYEHPIDILREILKSYSDIKDQLQSLHSFFPFLTGRVAYDFVAVVEPSCSNIKTEQFPPLRAAIYQHYIFFDHDQNTAKVVNIGTPPLARNFNLEIKDNTEKKYTTEQVNPDVSDQDFAAMIDVAKKHIVDGDIFQIVLSRNFCHPIHHDSFYFYQALRTISDAAFLFYFQEDEAEYLGASPEKLVSVKQDLIEVCPLAGTRKRVHSPSEKFVEEELLSDEKESAEHMMLVDLARNDVGSISKIGSVTVSKLKQLKKYSHVMHLSSSVKGILKSGHDAFDALMHCFPAGTLTGAPKIRAIQLINQLETSSRNFYGGAIFLLDLEFNMESCIAIRMAEVKNNLAKIRTGAGIVFDSEQAKEILETKNKANLLLHALMLSKEYADDITH